MVEFEVRDRDLLARIGRLRTKSGIIETPAFLPVINPIKEIVAPKDLWDNFGCKALITNAYITRKHFGEEAKKRGIHRILEFPGVIMTDSGAYQILTYGSVEVTNEEIVRYQEDIGSDIATILDVPTGWNVTIEYAKYTVEETLRRAKELENLKRRMDLCWVGPIQGGCYIDFISFSAREMGKLPFDIHALGSPTPIMEQYLFSILVDMIFAAKINAPLDRPFHLFGAGHPLIFSLVVALGCDLFDSAAYSLFAREDRYLTDYGTIRLENIEYLPCSCPICTKYDPRDLMEMPKNERERELSKHNLYVCFTEIKRIKQAIVEGRLWEYMEMRAYSHPSLLQALNRLQKYSEYIERYSPHIKKRGLFFFGPADLARPEVIRHIKRLTERYTPPEWSKILLLVPDFETKSTRKRKRLKKIVSLVCKKLGLILDAVHICFYSPAFGIIPIELSETYPLYQYEYAYPPDINVMNYMAEKILDYIINMPYTEVVILVESNSWSENLSKICIEKALKREIKTKISILNL
ncbi:MAG: tRNA guanosine(15) transglycosylase TgtA [candidate division WOR-3 bacterium]